MLCEQGGKLQSGLQIVMRLFIVKHALLVSLLTRSVRSSVLQKNESVTYNTAQLHHCLSATPCISFLNLTSSGSISGYSPMSWSLAGPLEEWIPSWWCSCRTASSCSPAAASRIQCWARCGGTDLWPRSVRRAGWPPGTSWCMPWWGQASGSSLLRSAPVCSCHDWCECSAPRSPSDHSALCEGGLRQAPWATEPRGTLGWREPA